MTEVYERHRSSSDFMGQFPSDLETNCLKYNALGEYEWTYHPDFRGAALPIWQNYVSHNYIVDQVNSRRKKNLGAGFYGTASCFHSRITFGMPLVADVRHIPSGVVIKMIPPHRLLCSPTEQMLLHKGAPGSVFSYFTDGELYPVLPSDIRNGLCEEAFNYFSDIFPSEFGFSEFISGFLELKALLPAVQDTITKTISGGYLNWKFGWENLLADLGYLSTAVQSVLDRMEFFRITYGKPTRLGFNRNNVWSPNLSDYDRDVPFVSFPLYGSRYVLSEFSCNFRATAWITQTLDYVTGLVGFLRVLFGALGLNNPVKAFWKVIPLSFVVDWFFDISTHLDNLTRLDPPVGWDVNDVTHSVTYQYKFVVSQLVAADHEVLGTPQPGLITVNRYDRKTGLSFDLELLNPDDFTGNKLLLLLAMLHQLG